MYRLFHHKGANIAIIERLKAQQSLVCRVSLVGIQRQAESWRAFANGLYTCHIIPDVAANLDLDTVYPSCNYILCQFIAVFRCHHRDTHICLDRSTGATEENVERDSVGVCQRVKQRHLDTGNGCDLAEIYAAHQFRKCAPVGCIFSLIQRGTTLSPSQRRLLGFACTRRERCTLTIADTAIVECDCNQYVACIRNTTRGNGKWLQQRNIQWLNGDGTNGST